MPKNRKLFGIGVVVVVLLVAWLLYQLRPGTQFLIGGAMIDLGYRLQDHLESFDFEHDHGISPDDVWKELQEQNALAAAVRVVPTHGTIRWWPWSYAWMPASTPTS